MRPTPCPAHLTDVARNEWRRLATPLHDMGVLSITDRATLAAYCQAWARWVEAEEHLAKGPALIKAPSGYVQQSPWLDIANKQLEIMGWFMAELGLSLAARARVRVPGGAGAAGVDGISVKFVTVYEDKEGVKIRWCPDGRRSETPGEGPHRRACHLPDTYHFVAYESFRSGANDRTGP